MKLLVDEIPFCQSDCPFSREIPMSRYDEKKKCRYRYVGYECDLTKDFCDLECGTCSGLKVLEIKE